MGPSTARTTSVTAAASAARPRSGLAAAITGCPASSSRSMTASQLEDSAKAPWTRMIVGGIGRPFDSGGLSKDACGGDAGGVAHAGGTADEGSGSSPFDWVWDYLADWLSQSS